MIGLVILLLVIVTMFVLGAVLLVIRQMLINRNALPAALTPAPHHSTTEDRFSPLRKDELLAAFAVADEEPLLQGIIHVLHAMEIERGDNASESDLSADVSKGYAMAQGALKDGQEEILRWVDEANQAKRGSA